MQPFVYTAAPARIVFGAGSSAGLVEEIRRLGLSRALVLSTPQQKGDAEALAASSVSLLPVSSLMRPCIRRSR